MLQNTSRTWFAVIACLLLAACKSNSDGSSDVVNDGDIEPTATPPNILRIVADDQGLDASAQYSVSQDLPNTPVIDQLAAEGLVFENAWATPSCTTTRGSLITGQHGVNSGVDTTPSLMDTSILTLQKFLKNEGSSPNYASAVIGKWHLAGGDAPQVTHPNEAGVDYYAGTIEGTIDSYYEWLLALDGSAETSDVYHTTAMTDLAVDWVAQQDVPWFLWLAYVAPHAPFHLPPSDLHSLARRAILKITRANTIWLPSKRWTPRSAAYSTRCQPKLATTR